ncbi:MAG: GrpB family protein [Eubacteriales bacterium]|nr:GrpB family protein [Eubacteriales bacterium]
MSIGLKRGVVELADLDPEWETLAVETIQRLWNILGDVAVDIQHVGSTAIKGIKAKPIIDIAVAVRDFESVKPFIAKIEEADFVYRPEDDDDWKLYFVRRSDNGATTTHHVHIVRVDNEHWKDFILFRDFLNQNKSVSADYETVKLKLMVEYKNDRLQYTNGKHDFVMQTLELARIWDDFGREFSEITPIIKGWSEDKKYCVTKSNGTKYLLRITPIERYKTRKSLFEMLKQVESLGVPMCRPIDFGICTAGVYSLQGWIDGEDLEEVLPLLSETEQYILGLKSGEIARKMHSIPAPETQEEWAARFNRKTNYKIQKYRECGIRFDGDEKVIAYIEANRHLLENRPQCFQHGDYHVGNMMLENGELRIIDFDRYDFGDPWEEFNRIVWCAQKSPHFATGQLCGYFGGSPPHGLEPPIEFFKLLAFYISSNTLSSIYWALDFDNIELETMMNQAKDVLSWYDNMESVVPTWYKKNIELMDIYNSDRKRTGRYWIRGSTRKGTEYILIAAALLRRSDGRYLITKRSPNKDDANMWNIQGGAALAGEDSLTAAIRENTEECGIVPNASNATLLMGDMKNTAFFDIWLFEQEFSLDDVALHDGETCDVMAATLNEIIELNSRGGFTNGTVITADEFIAKLKEWEALL